MLYYCRLILLSASIDIKMNFLIKKGKSIEYRRYDFAFDIPIGHEKQFLEIIKLLKNKDKGE